MTDKAKQKLQWARDYLDKNPGIPKSHISHPSQHKQRARKIADNISKGRNPYDDRDYYSDRDVYGNYVGKPKGRAGTWNEDVQYLEEHPALAAGWAALKGLAAKYGMAAGTTALLGTSLYQGMKGDPAAANAASAALSPAMRDPAAKKELDRQKRERRINRMKRSGAVYDPDGIAGKQKMNESIELTEQELQEVWGALARGAGALARGAGTAGAALGRGAYAGAGAGARALSTAAQSGYRATRSAAAAAKKRIGKRANARKIKSRWKAEKKAGKKKEKALDKAKKKKILDRARNINQIRRNKDAIPRMLRQAMVLHFGQDIAQNVGQGISSAASKANPVNWGGSRRSASQNVYGG